MEILNNRFRDSLMIREVDATGQNQTSHFFYSVTAGGTEAEKLCLYDLFKARVVYS